MSKLIVHIIDRMPADGAERLLVEILRYRNTDYRYHLLCLAEGGSLVPAIEALGVKVTILNKKPGIDLRHAWELYRWLSQHKPTVVHTHLFTADAWGRSCAYLARVPGIFSTVHSTNTWKSKAHLIVDRLLASVSNKIIACSNQVANTLRTQGLSARKVISIPNGVDLQRIEEATEVDLCSEFSIAQEIPVFALVGRLHEAKGHTDLLPVLEQIAQTGRHFKVLFVGEGELEASLKDAVRQRELSEHVVFTGFRSDVIGILKSVDFLLMPSRWEGLPMTLLESMACGTPALAASVGGIPDVIDSGTNGILYPPGDSSGLASGINQILDHLLSNTKMHTAARKTVVDRYSAQSIAAAYDALYEEVN